MLSFIDYKESLFYFTRQIKKSQSSGNIYSSLIRLYISKLVCVIISFIWVQFSHIKVKSFVILLSFYKWIHIKKNSFPLLQKAPLCQFINKLLPLFQPMATTDFISISVAFPFLSETESHSVGYDSLQPHGLYSPWNSLGQMLEWVAFLFSRESSQSRIEPRFPTLQKWSSHWRNGVAIMVNKRVRNAVLGWNLKNDRMMSIHFQGKPFKITVIQICVLTSNTE